MKRSTSKRSILNLTGVLTTIEQAELRSKAVHEWRLAKTLKMIQEGHWTIRRAASVAGLNYHEILDKMAENGVDSGPTLKELRETLDSR